MIHRLFDTGDLQTRTIGAVTIGTGLHGSSQRSVLLPFFDPRSGPFESPVAPGIGSAGIETVHVSLIHTRKGRRPDRDDEGDDSKYAKYTSQLESARIIAATFSTGFVGTSFSGLAGSVTVK